MARNVEKNSPSVIARESFADSSHEVWLRITAFLSLKAPLTQETYKGVLTEWCKFLKTEPGTPESAAAMVKAKDLHAIAFRSYLDKRPGERPRNQSSTSKSDAIDVRRGLRKEKRTGLESTQSNATIAKKFAVLRRIYRVLMAANLGIIQNPFDSDLVPPPPKESGRKRPTKMLDFSVVKKVIAQSDDSTPKGLRDKAILCALFGGALRRGEVISLRVGDVQRTPSGTSFFYLRATKAKRDAQQALPKWAAEVIERLVKQRVKEGALAGDRLFVSYTGRGGKVATKSPISPSGIYSLFRRVCDAAGAGEHLSPHSARATAITRLLAEGVPHREVQEFSRHSSIQMVELYDKRRIGVDENVGRGLDYD